MNKIVFFFYILILAETVSAQKKVGIGTNSPQQKLSVDSTVVIDQGGYNIGTAPALSFGSSSGEGIGSIRAVGSNRYGLDLYTSFQKRLQIYNNGNVSIGSTDSTQKLAVGGTILGTTLFGKDVIVDRAGENAGNYAFNDPGLFFGGNNTGEFISSSRSGTKNPYGLDFWTGEQPRMSLANNGNFGIGVRNPTNKLEVDGTILTTGNVVVQTNKGIIRNNGSTQLKQVVTSIPVNYSSPNIPSLGTVQFHINWAENFSGTPVAAYLGNVTSGAGGWAEVVMTIAGVTSTGCDIYVFNPRSIAFGPNFIVNIVAVGPQ